MNPIPCPYCGETMKYEERHTRVGWTPDTTRDHVLLACAICCNDSCPARTASPDETRCNAWADLVVDGGLDGERLGVAWDELRAKFRIASTPGQIRFDTDARLARELDTQPR